MAIVTVSNLSQFGIVYDRPAHTLPLEAFSAGQNVRFREGGVEKVEGHKPIYGALSLANPNWAHWFPKISNPHWVYSNGSKIYAVNGTTHGNITRQSGGVDVDYNATDVDRWSACTLGGLGYLNNYNDAPQMWSVFDTTVRLQDLPNWPVGQRAQSLRAYKVFLLAFAPKLSSGEILSNSVLWSGPAEAGQPPASWDYTDPSTLAGLKTLGDGGDAIVDALKMGDNLMVYKEDSVYALQFTTAATVFNDYRIVDNVGVLGKDCVAATPKGHVILGYDDVMIHRGQRGTEQSLLSERQRKWLFSVMSASNYHNSFVVTHPTKQEVWICFPQDGYTYANIALVWNWETGSVGFRDLPEVPFGSAGTFVEIDPATTWDADTQSWDEDDTIWGSSGLDKAVRYPVMVDYTNSQLLRIGNTETFNGSTYTSFVERTGLPVAGQDHRGQPIVDASKIKFVRALYPNFEADPGTEIQIQVGGQMELSDPIEWSDPQTFTVGEDYMVDVLVSARYLAVRFQNDTSTPWKLNSYGLDLDIIGRH